MLIIPPSKYRKERRFTSDAAVAGPVALGLVSAVFSADDQAVYLTFNREIDITALDVSQIDVLDGTITNTRWAGSSDGTGMTSPTALRVSLVDSGYYGSDSVDLFASDATGIVAVDDGSAWGGADYVPLPLG